MAASQLPVSQRHAVQKTLFGRLISQIDLVRNLVFLLFVFRFTRKAWWQLKGRGPIGTAQDLYFTLRRLAFTVFLRLPGVRKNVDLEIKKSLLKLENSLVPSGPGIEHHRKLPVDGWSNDKIVEELKKAKGMEQHSWEAGKVSGSVYHGGQDLIELQTKAYGMFTVANPLHPDLFPGIRKMEAEIVAMVLSMFHAPEGAAGVSTSGGTESIIMACLGARQKAYIERGVTEPEIIIPNTAHAAFSKAAEYFKMKVHTVDCPAPDYKVHVPSVSRLINTNTVLLVGSAPNFPHGIIDDITLLSRLALRKKIPLHVDCCLGSFLMPCLEKAGFETEPFDFRLKGVTSISVDTHKYGFAPKGNSTILYRSARLRAYQYFIMPDWPGGVYASPSIAGSRPGALIAGCWASMMALGEDGYISACHKIVGATKRIEDGLRGDPTLSRDLQVVGKPLVSVVAFTSNSINIYHVADAMSKRGWHLNALQDPPAIHIAVTLPVITAVDTLLSDLREVLGEIKAAAGAGAKPATGDATALYGVAGSLPDKSVVKELARGFLDILYKA